MTKFVPPGFDAAKVTAGLHKAMGFGESVSEPLAFYLIEKGEVPPGTRVDDSGLPFDPAIKRTDTKTIKHVDCAVEYSDRATTSNEFGQTQPDRITITLLDPDYQQVKGFRFVVAGGDKYFYAKTEPPIALGSIDVWIIHCTSQDES